MQIIRRSFAKEGISWCFRGWTPAWIRLAPNSLIIFMSLEVRAVSELVQVVYDF